MSKVIVYSTPVCPFCKKVKQLLTEQGVEYEEKNVQSDQKALEEMMEKSGQVGVPVTDINGKIIIGFKQDEIIAALEK